MSSKETILYVDDEPINLMLFGNLFKKRYHVVTAGSGSEGFEVLNNNQNVSIVISDMKMPEMNGLQFIQKARPRFPNILFYILTGYEVTPEIELAMKEGIIKEYFQKPFEIDEIDVAIKKSMKDG